jgi:hypothetical protein
VNLGIVLAEVLGLCWFWAEERGEFLEFYCVDVFFVVVVVVCYVV